MIIQTKFGIGDEVWYVEYPGGYTVAPSSFPSEIGMVRAFIEEGEEDETLYMLKATGVGSGRLHREEALFLTKEEASAWCDKENGWKATSQNGAKGTTEATLEP
jgi:hypothetical protein